MIKRIVRGGKGTLQDLRCPLGYRLDHDAGAVGAIEGVDNLPVGFVHDR